MSGASVGEGGAPDDARRRAKCSVDGAGLQQLEEGDLGLEPGPVGALHIEYAGHRAEGRRQRTARGVLEGLPGLDYGLSTLSCVLLTAVFVWACGKLLRRESVIFGR